MKEERVIGPLLGGAVGDTLGQPVEFMRMDGIRIAFLPLFAQETLEMAAIGRASGIMHMGSTFGFAVGAPLAVLLLDSFHSYTLMWWFLAAAMAWSPRRPLGSGSRQSVGNGELGAAVGERSISNPS